MRFFPGILVAILLATGCESASKPVEMVSEMAVEASYIGILSELTEIMSQKSEDPTVTLEAVRKYIASNKSRISETINALNRELLDMDENAREKYRASASVRVEGALEAYAEAQNGLKKRMKEAQRWELGEALMQLR